MKFKYLLLMISAIGMSQLLLAKETRSIKYYQQKQPHIMRAQPNEATWLRFGNLELENLDGLQDVAGKEKIQVIALPENNLKEIPAFAFKGYPQLHNIALNSNKIEAIDNKAFAELGELRFLSLSNNPIKKIDPNLFNDLVKLTDLELNDLQLEELDPFPALPELQILFLNNNNLTHINPKVFAKLPKLKWLYLTGNPIGKTEYKGYQKALQDTLPNVNIKF